MRNEIPVFVGAIGRKSVEMAAEICDGWIPIFFSVDAFEATWGEHLEAGFAKGGRQRSDLEVSPSLQVAIDGDLEAAKSVVKAGLVLYFGGMGSRKTNFYVDLAHRFGFGDVADEVQQRFQDGDRDGAFEAMPDEIVEATSLVGTEAEVAERVERFRGAGIDRLIVSPVHWTGPSSCTPSSAWPPSPACRRAADTSHNLPRRVKIGVPKETADGERRVALVPDVVKSLKKNEHVEVLVERGAGDAAGHPDSQYAEAGAEVVEGEVTWGADVVLRVAAPSTAEIGQAQLQPAPDRPPLALDRRRDQQGAGRMPASPASRWRRSRARPAPRRWTRSPRRPPPPATPRP